MRLQNGIDLVEIGRMEKYLQRESFWEKCFSAREQAYIKAQGNNAAQTAAALYAAKEAFAKAMGTGLRGFALPEAAVEHDDLGRPYFVLNGRAGQLAAGWRLALSLSHEGGLAIAMVTAWRED